MQSCHPLSSWDLPFAVTTTRNRLSCAYLNVSMMTGNETRSHFRFIYDFLPENCSTHRVNLPAIEPHPSLEIFDFSRGHFSIYITTGERLDTPEKFLQPEFLMILDFLIYIHYQSLIGAPHSKAPERTVVRTFLKQSGWSGGGWPAPHKLIQVVC